MRFAAASLVLGLVLAIALPCAADLLAEIPQSTALVPGAVLSTPTEVVLQTGMSQLVTFAAARAAWARARLQVGSRWSVELVGARTRAGAWREDRQEVRLARHGRAVSWLVGAASVRAQVADWTAVRHGRGWVEAAYRLGPVQIGARWEGPWQRDANWPASSLQVHAMARASGWAAGVWRPRASYAGPAAWGAGFAATLHDHLRLGMRLRAQRAEMLVWLVTGVWRVSLVLPVASRIAAGPTVAVGWAP
jgi:hypothetical protein